MKDPKIVNCGCGGKGILYESDPDYEHSYLPTCLVECEECGCRTDYYSDPIEAIEAWNTGMSGNVSKVKDRTKGVWGYGENEAGHDGYFCSVCETFYPWYYEYYHSSHDFISYYNFCPNCGADMRGENE